MKNETNYLQDIGEIRSLMERSSKFISLSGWAGIFAGIYALVGVYVAITYLHFNPQSLYIEKGEAQNISSNFLSVVLLALAIFLLLLPPLSTLPAGGLRKKRNYSGRPQQEG